MPIPDYQTLMLPVLRIAGQGEARVAAVVDQIADDVGLTADERAALLPSGRQRVIHNRIHWAKFYLTKAGLIEALGKGRFIATPEGLRVLATRPERIDTHSLKAYPAFAAFYGKPAATVDDGAAASPQDQTPEELIDNAWQALQSALRDDLIARILLNTPDFFERVIIDLLVAMGYGGSHADAATRLGRSGDGGVDGVINEDRLGLDRVYVQAKRYAPENSVGRPDVQGFLGSLVGFGATKGVFVTTSSFSSGARDFVRHLPQRIVLIDGARLADLMIEHDVGVRTSRMIAVKRLDEDFFTEAD